MPPGIGGIFFYFCEDRYFRSIEAYIRMTHMSVAAGDSYGLRIASRLLFHFGAFENHKFCSYASWHSTRSPVGTGFPLSIFQYQHNEAPISPPFLLQVFFYNQRTLF